MDRSNVLLQVANLLASTEELDRVLGQVTEVVRQGVAARRCAILTLSEDGGTLVPGSSAAATPDRKLLHLFRQMPGIELAASPALALALEEGRTVVIEEAASSDQIPELWADAFDLDTLLFLPLRHMGQPSGMMVVEYAAGTVLDPEDMRTLEAVASQAAVVLWHTRSEEEARRTSAALADRVLQQSVLLDVTTLLATTLDVDQLLQRVAESLAMVLPVTYCRIAVWHADRRLLEIRAGYARRTGAEDVLIGHTIDPRRSPWHQQVLTTGQPLSVQGVSAIGDDARLRGGAQSLLLLPIVGRDRLHGIVTIGEDRSDSRSPFSLDRIDFYRTLSTQAALALEKAELFQQREDAFWQAIHSIASVVEARDMGTHDHVYRVSAIAMAVANRLGVTRDAVEAIKRAGILHDFGKITVPDRILLKPGPLTEDEWLEMRSHSSAGSQLLGRIPFLDEVIPLVRHHHESWDGRGYPEGLSGDRIPLGSRVIAVADTYDAMTTDRPYRAALEAERALAEINVRAGLQFDPDVVAAFAQAFADGSLKRALSLAHGRGNHGRLLD